MITKSNNGLVFKREIEQNEFLRQTFLSFTTDDNAPDDILEAEFSSTKLDTFQGVAIGAVVDLDYSVSVGYDRFVQQKVYNKTRKDFETKTEKVTDWQPMSASFSGEFNGYAENSDNPRVELAPCIATAYCTAKSENKQRASESFDEGESLIPAKTNAINAAKEYAKSSAVNACKKNLPGDTFKDFSYSGTIQVKSQAELAIPVYSVDYEYEGSTYTASSFASGAYQRWGKIPERKKVTAIENEKKSFFSMFWSYIKSCAEGNGGTSGNMIKLTTGVTCATVFLALLAILLPLSVGITVGKVFFVLASLTLFAQIIALPKIIDMSYAVLLKKKLSLLKFQLEKHGLSPITDKEENDVEAQVNNGRKNNKNINIATIVISCFLYAIAAMTSEMFIFGLIVAIVMVGAKLGLHFWDKKK